jgi:hypothetical protein
VTTKIAGIVNNIQQLEEEIEMPDMEPMTLATDSRSITQVVADPGRHRTMTTHVDRNTLKVREYVRRGRVIIRWCPGDENWSDIFTKPLANPKFTYFGTQYVATSNGSYLTQLIMLRLVHLQ